MRRPSDVFSAYNSITGPTFTTTPETVPLDTEHRPSSDTYVLGSPVGELEVTEDDIYEVTYSCSTRPTTNSRTQGQAWLELNGTEVEGTRILMYCRQANYGATGSSQIYLDLQAGDVLRVRAQRTAGGSTLTFHIGGSRLTLRRL